jgi:hypothetical protein
MFRLTRHHQVLCLLAKTAALYFNLLSLFMPDTGCHFVKILLSLINFIHPSYNKILTKRQPTSGINKDSKLKYSATVLASKRSA